LVEVIERWSDFEAAADHCHVGVYQVRCCVNGTEVRVRAGRYGFIGFFEDSNDHRLKQIRDYCAERGFIKIRGAIRDEAFFTAPTVE